MKINNNGQLLVEYFKECLDLLGPNSMNCAKILHLVTDEYYIYPAASGKHHNGSQARIHGLIYHVWEGFWNLNQLIRDRADIISRYNSTEEFSGEEKSEHALLTAYLLHDILKYKSHPSGSNYTHDEDCYKFLSRLGIFSDAVLQIIRYTHGVWSSSIATHKNPAEEINKNKYSDLIWLSHYADITASRFQDIKVIESDKDTLFDKEIMHKRKNYSNKSGIDISWWDDISTEDIKSLVLGGETDK